MDFENASHGVSFRGMEDYKRILQVDTFGEIKKAINDTTEVKNAVEAGWVGTAADNFINNIQVGANRMSEQITEIENMLITELDGIMSQIGDMDENLVEREG